MHRSIASISILATLGLSIAGCFNPDKPGADTDDESASSGSDDTDGPGQTDDGPGQTDDGPGQTDDGPNPTDDGPSPTDGDSETAEPVDEPPVIESFTINGETEIAEQTRAGRFDVVPMWSTTTGSIASSSSTTATWLRPMLRSRSSAALCSPASTTGRKRSGRWRTTRRSRARRAVSSGCR